ncbi:MAG: heterodisulfide reductase subunit E, partial [Desulfovibrio sp.]|nr:heterodisulfide reductase subunit E [Desulfovibrio sp.]
LANFGALLLVVGLVGLTVSRIIKDKAKHVSTFYDWYLLGVIWVVFLTGMGSQIFRLMNIKYLAYPVYYLHLVSVFMLIAYLPWSKLGHMVYRTAALAYARYLGRKAV